MKKHQSRSEHADKLMGGHHKGNDRSPADILMRGHHAMGGAAMPSLMSGAHHASNPTPNLTSQYKKGGRPHHKRGRACHAEGGEIKRADGGAMGLNRPQKLMGADKSTWSPTPLKKGGNPHRNRRAEGGEPREHHFWGALAGAVLPSLIGGIANKIFGKKDGHAEGGKVNVHALQRAMGGSGKVRKGMMTEDGRMR